jgi:hypothetical protein
MSCNGFSWTPRIRGPISNCSRRSRLVKYGSLLRRQRLPEIPSTNEDIGVPQTHDGATISSNPVYAVNDGHRIETPHGFLSRLSATTADGSSKTRGSTSFIRIDS